MPKGNRGKRDYEKEIALAIARMRKYPEHLRSAQSNTAFKTFLDNIGIFPQSIEAGKEFWENVRQGILDEVAEEKKAKEPPTMKQYRETKTIPEVAKPYVYTAKSGKEVNVKGGQIKYRSTITGRYVSLKSIKE